MLNVKEEAKFLFFFLIYDKIETFKGYDENDC